MSTNLDKKKVALCTGITGQDGSYLAEFLLEKGYKVLFTTNPTFLVLILPIVKRIKGFNI